MEDDAGAYRLSNLNNKPGMDGIDKRHVAQMIYEASKGSQFYENEQRKEAKLKVKIEEMLNQFSKLRSDPSLLVPLQASTQKQVEHLEATRDLSQTWIHVDMDMFYVAVELRDAPHLRGKPVAVGGYSMLTTTSYEARKFGVRSAMPGFIGKKLCPELIMLPVNFAKYRAVSAQIRAIFEEYDPRFLPMSLDEAHLNVTQYLSAHPEMTGDSVAREIRSRIEAETQLTASAGIACNMLLAKMCSNIQKPNGQYVLPSTREAVSAFMRELPASKLHGVGKVTNRLLEALGVHMCPDIVTMRAELAYLLTPVMFSSLLQRALGIGTSQTPPDEPRKSVGHERTFAELAERREQLEKCRELCEKVAADLARENLRCRSITVKLKQTDFTVKTRAVTATRPVCSADDLFRHASELMIAEMPLRLRLMGVRVSEFGPPAGEGPLARFLKSNGRKSAALHNDNMEGDRDDDADGDGEPLECPVCARRLQMTVAEMEQHVDQCLQSSQEVNVGPVARAVSSGIEAIQADSPIIATPEERDSDSDCRVVERAAASDVASRECPVCERSLLLSEANLEKHVQNCLESVVTQQRQVATERVIFQRSVGQKGSVDGKQNSKAKRLKSSKQ